MRHISTMHREATLSKQAARQLQYLGKVRCVECNGIRDHKTHHCYNCGAGTRQKAPRQGPVLLGVATASAQPTDAATVVEVSRMLAGLDVPVAAANPTGAEQPFIAEAVRRQRGASANILRRGLQASWGASEPSFRIH